MPHRSDLTTTETDRARLHERLDERLKAKRNRPITLALMNAYAQFFVWFLFWAFLLLTLSGGSSVVTITKDSPLFPLSTLAFYAPGYALPFLAFTLVFALESSRWQVIAIVAMLLNAGLMLFAALVIDVVFFLPIVGYIVSAYLVGYVWVKRRKEGKTA